MLSKTRYLFIAVVMHLVFVGNACSTNSPKPEKPHHTAGGFINPGETQQTGFWDFVKWRWNRAFKDIPAAESYEFPLASTEVEFLKANQSLTTATWIGHATIFLQINGVNILTDPQFSQRASPLQWIGPKRAVQPAIAMEDLPNIDYVVISHDHYDSLDKDTILSLQQRAEGESVTFIVPLKLKAWFEDLGINNVVELDWWESYRNDSITITAVPARHWSKRSLFSRNSTLWAGWVVKSDSFNFYFCGDSGYAPLFKQIGDQLGPFDLAAIPIGAYEPRWFMQSKHINPEEAVQVHKDLRAKQSIAIHWGTFVLTDEPLQEPPRRLGKALQDQGVAPEAFLVLQHGQTLRF
ncbi:MBL fold metallo-hydrolase [Kaarinaea lacus]